MYIAAGLLLFGYSTTTFLLLPMFVGATSVLILYVVPEFPKMQPFPSVPTVVSVLNKNGNILYRVFHTLYSVKTYFSGKDGHLNDTPANRHLLTDLANDPFAFVGTDKYGNSWNIRTNPDGSQTWVRYQNGTINEGGQNSFPRSWNNETGLNHNPIKRGR